MTTDVLSFFILPVGALLIPLVASAAKNERVAPYLALFLLGIAALFQFLPRGAVTTFDSLLFAADGLTRFFSAVFLGVAILVTLFMFKRPERGTLFYTMLLAGSAAMMFVAASRNIIGIFLGIELLSLAFYELCALKKDDLGMESATKLFFVSIVSSALFVVGAILVYSASGTFELAQFLVLRPDPAFLMGAALLFGALSFKMSVFPFNLWIPDVYQGAPSDVTALLAGGAKKAGFAAFLRLFLPLAQSQSAAATVLPAATMHFSWFMAALSVLTMTFGNLAGLVQKNVKRMIVYSVVAHAGFLLMGLAALTPLGYTGLLFHILVHALMATGVFLLFVTFERYALHTLDDFNGLSKRSPFAAVLFMLFLLSLTGIPPLAGFLSKFVLWSSAIDAGLWWLAAAAIVNSALSTYFYFVILRRVWGFEATASAARVTFSWNEKTALLIPAALLLFFGVYPAPLLKVIETVVSATLS